MTNKSIQEAQNQVIYVDGTEYFITLHWYDKEEDTGTREGYAVQDVFTATEMDNCEYTLDKHLCSNKHSDLYDKIEELINEQ